MYIFAWSILRESLKVSIELEMKDLKSGERERREVVIIPRLVSTMDQVRRDEVSIWERWCVMARSRIIWMLVRKAERAKRRAMR
jgi:hypothetical protein